MPHRSLCLALLSIPCGPIRSPSSCPGGPEGAPSPPKSVFCLHRGSCPPPSTGPGWELSGGPGNRLNGPRAAPDRLPPPEHGGPLLHAACHQRCPAAQR